MSPATRQSIEILASLAGSFLLLLIFLMLVAACVLLWLLGRGLSIARVHADRIALWLTAQAQRGEALTRDSIREMAEPQIRALSTWAGLRAGLRSLLSGGADETDSR